MIETSRIEKRPGIMVAFDMEDVPSAIRLAEELSAADGNFAIKIGRPLEMQTGKEVISKVRDATDIPIVYDGKIADIPYISAKIAEIAYDAGADAIIMHAFVGADVVREVVNLGMGDVITVIEMTHPGSVEYLENVSEKLIRKTSEIGVDGVVLPATRPERVSALSELLNSGYDGDSETYIISPGIHAQGAEPGDAIINGSDYEVVGRAIYQSEDPKGSAERIYRQAISRLGGV
ncbi:MAG: orotidine-5'-phosphate decarboxylase [Euryarchaeota archaeon]|nr:MAG: Orotidine 5'-phosphate decarboxylase [ANME-2 cluster archaeon]MEA1865009.1 orotidine-5'-phosphate decarboxylase [Euryarchaeota archaeon]